MILHNRYQDSFLGRQPVGGLMEREGVIGVHDGVRHLKPTMSRQAVHKIGVLAGLRHQCVIYLVGTEQLDARVQFVLLTHAGPNVGIQGIDTLYGVRLGIPFHFLTLCRSISFRANRPERESRKLASLPERTGHVVPVPDIRNFLALQLAPYVRQGENVGQCLTRMLPITQRIHYRDRRESRQLLEVHMPEHARDNTVHPQRKVPRQIRNGLALAQLALL